MLFLNGILLNYQNYQKDMQGIRRSAVERALVS